MSIIEKIGKASIRGKLILLGTFLLVVGIVFVLPMVFASPVPVKSIIIESGKLDYNKKELGSYNIEKSAEWIAKGKARITFDIDTVMKMENKYTDIILVLDVSGSMEGDKLTRVKQDSIDLINTLLSDSNNRAALITFETSSKIVSLLTNNKDELIDKVNALITTGGTNYYSALVNVDNVLRDYKKKKMGNVSFYS